MSNNKQRMKNKTVTVLAALYAVLGIATLIMALVVGFFDVLGRDEVITGHHRFLLTLMSMICVLCSLVFGLIIIRVRNREEKVIEAAEDLNVRLREKGEENILIAKSKTEFIANMSHEIRTPMNAISCVTELLLKEDLPERAHNYAEIMKSSSDSLLDMVNEILDFSKIDSGKMKLEESGYSLKGLIDDAKNIIAVRLTEKPVAFTIDVESTIPDKLIGDEIRIRQILINLLGNAVKYTTKGNIELKVTYERLSKETIDVSFSVTDTGCGISPGAREKLFEKFEQADTANHRMVEGTGLGLSIASDLCNMMGGKITLESELGSGSNFTATIRQRVDRPEAYVVAESMEKNIGVDVMVVEDDKYYRESLVTIFKALNVPVHTVSNETEAEVLLSTLKIDYVLCGADQFTQVTELVKQISPASLPILLAKMTDEGIRSDVLKYPVLKKPFDIVDVNKIIGDKGDAKEHADVNIGRFSAPDARILVVDDNHVNLKVAKALFESFKSQVVAVDSGFEAVELIRLGEKFDIIFMDHLMPGLDGVQAAGRIWEIEGEKRTPIIALTANTGGGIEAMFMENGLSDFIPKPIVINHLYYVLQKWLPKGKQVYEAKSSSVAQDDAGTCIKLDVKSACEKLWNDERLYREMVTMLTDRAPELFGELKMPFKAEMQARTAGIFAAMCNSAGAYPLAEMLREIGEIAAIGQAELFAAKLKGAEDEYKLTLREIRAYLES